MRSRQAAMAAAVAIGAVGANPARAFDIELDFSQDTFGFFTANPLAQTAIEQAAADLSAVITTDLGAVQDTILRTFDADPGTTAEGIARFDFRYVYTHPSLGTQQFVDPIAVPANEVRVFVGAQQLSGNTLGRGGAGAFGVGVQGGSPGSTSDINEFETNAQGAWSQGLPEAQANIRRGAGPVTGTISGTITSSQGFFSPLNYTLEGGLGVGNVWFDNDSDWHFDHTAPVPAGKSDFYSVALHELIHAVGFSTTQGWSDQVGTDPRDWLGSAAIAELGTGDNVLESDSNHILEGTMSTTLDGTPQEAVMDPTLTIGTRKELTVLDLAFLEDLGFTIASMSIPGDFNGDGSVDAVDIDLLFDNLGGDADTYDLTGDVTVDSADVDELVRVILETEFGDANLDGAVNVVDLGVLATNFGQLGDWSEGDFNGSGTVNLVDLGILATSFGFSASQIAELASAFAADDLSGVAALVPEPAAPMLAAVGLAAIAWRRR